MERTVRMMLLSKIILLLVVSPTVGRHHHHHNMTLSREEGTKLKDNKDEAPSKKDIVTPLVTLAGSIASTYLQKWMLKSEAALASISNLSGKNYLADGCDAINAEIPDPPQNLRPRTGSAHVEAFKEGTVRNGLNKVGEKLKGLAPGKKDESNVWIRCAFKKPYKGDIAKVVFIMSLRTNSDNLGTPSRLAIALCTNKGKDEANCNNYESVDQMKELVEKTESPVKQSKYTNILESLTFEKSETRVLEPIYLCSGTKNVVDTCVSAMMGNGGKAVGQIYIHDESPSFYLPADNFVPY